MKKIPSLFMRNYKANGGDGFVRDEIVPGSEWVINGEGKPTRKFDGTSCFVENVKLFKRYDAKKGRTPPADFIPAQEPDPVTGHWTGWVPVKANNPADKYHLEAFNHGFDLLRKPFVNGTYELIGEKINGNPERIAGHYLIKHGDEFPEGCMGYFPRTFNEIKRMMQNGFFFEGIVWHHPDGRMVKIKKKDFKQE